MHEIQRKKRQIPPEYKILVRRFLIFCLRLSLICNLVLHCRLFGISCPEVSERLVGQIQAWQIKESCMDAGENCSYEVRSESVFTHTQSVKNHFCAAEAESD